MKTRITRIIALLLAAVLIMGVAVYRLIQLQLIRGSDPTVRTVSNAVRKYEEQASRGEIMDRNGVVLAGNALSYSVQADYYLWDAEEQNDVILRLYDILTEAGVPWEDVLPLTMEWPTKYTYTTLESGAGKRFADFVTQQGWGSPSELDPGRLFNLMCQHYGVDGNLTLAQRRALVGIRYFLDDRQFSAYNTPLILASGVTTATVARIAEYGNAMPGVEIRVSDSREYFSDYASHILGRVAAISPEEYAERKDDGYRMNDTIGKDGMERALESWLRGVNGTRAVEVDRTTGQVVTEYMLEETSPGRDCLLTLDLELQKRTEDALAETIRDIQTKGQRSKTGDGADVEGGAAVVIDVNTGEILAMASYPSFSLERFSTEFAENRDNPLKPFLNRAVQSAYSPGSTYKMCTALAALEEGVITPRTKIVDKGIYDRYEDYKPRCWIYRQYGGTHGSINVSDALKFSCNYFFYEMGYLLGIDTLDNYARQLGLGQKTGIELPGERAGILAGPEAREANGGATWFPADTLMAAIGQGDNQFSPVQLANYVATIVNGGTRYRPHLLKRVAEHNDGAVVMEQEPEILNTVAISDSTLEAIKKGMRGVVTENGTASSYFADFPIMVGGKTGSAQMTNHSATGVFVSFAPYDDPQIAVCVVGEYASTGGSLAPVAIAVYDEYFGLGLREARQAAEEAARQAAANPPRPTAAPTQPAGPAPEPTGEPLPEPTEGSQAPEEGGEQTPETGNGE